MLSLERRGRWSIVFGVAHNPDSISLMGCADAASWNNKRPCGVAFGFQVKEHSVESQADVTINVFENNPRGSFGCNNFADVRPDVTWVFFAFPVSRLGEGLARVSCCEDIAVWNKVVWVIS